MLTSGLFLPSKLSPEKEKPPCGGFSWAVLEPQLQLFHFLNQLARRFLSIAI